MASGMHGFVKGRSEDFDGHRDNSQSRRPPTEKTRIHHQHDGRHHIADTNTDSFDRTRTSIGDQDQVSSDGSHDDDAGFEQPGESGYQAFDGLDLQMDALKRQLERDRQGFTDADTYPPTTSGEPEDENEAEVNIHPQLAQGYAEQPHIAYSSNVQQRREVPIPLANQPQARRTELSKDDFKVKVEPTLSQKEVRNRKKSQSKTQAIPHVTTKHTSQQPHAINQQAATHNLPSRVPKYAQPAPNGQNNQPYQQVHHNYANGPDPRQRYAGETTYRQERITRHDHAQQYGDEVVNHYEQQEDSDQSSEVDDEEDFEPEFLDYDIDELRKKKLEELQNDPFDGPPREDNQESSSDFSSKLLGEKLEIVFKSNAQGQRDFFASLKIEEWEEAGEWFQDRFAGVLSSLKESRQKRRRLASEYEKKIFDRNQAVVKKRKITDDALKEMKVSGDRVLTPQKKQKFAE